MTKRAAVAFFYDEDGVVDKYMLHLLRSMKEHVDYQVFVSNGPLSKESELSLVDIVDDVIIRKNENFDVWAYKEGIEHIGYDRLKQFDELILYNHTFYGPIFPFSEMFDKMGTLLVDFWGISIHGKLDPNPFTNTGILPAHINSHFIAVRHPLLSSKAFKHYWDEMEPINSYNDSVLKHESRFTKHFADLGYSFDAYVKLEDYGSPYPVFIDIAETIENRSPILKRRIFFHTPLFHDNQAIDLPRALRIIEAESDYDTDLIWENISRTTKPRELSANAGLLKILPKDSAIKKPSKLRIAVCAHVYYVDLLPELLAFANNISGKFDFICTTDSEDKKILIEKALGKEMAIARFDVRMVEENRGRDMSALFITCRDIFLEDRYDLVCRLHTKKSPQVGQTQSLIFKRHLLENLLYSKGYVSELTRMFEQNSNIGMAYPPAIHIGYSTLGNGWFANKPTVEQIMLDLDIHVPLDDDTPVAPYGTMFWFRPDALKKLFEHKWKWGDFNAEPDHVDGGLAHGLERSMSYVAADSRFITMQVMNPDQAAFSYGLLEYKLQTLLAHAPRVHFLGVEGFMKSWKAAGHPTVRWGLKTTGKEFLLAFKRSLLYRFPRLFYVLRPLYRLGRSTAKVLHIR